MNTKVVFYIATEFHYLAAHGILTSVLKHVDPSSVCFLIRQEPGKKCRLDDICIPDRYLKVNVCFSHLDGKKYSDVINICNFLLVENSISHFISFLFHDPLYVYLSYELKKNGTNVGLAPDGMGAYVKFKSSTIRSRWVHTKNSYRFFRVHNLNFKRIWFASWDFGRNGNYSTIYALTEVLPFVTNKEIVRFKMQFNDSYLNELTKAFNVDFTRIPIDDSVVLIISENKANKEYEKKLIHTIRQILPTHTIILKRHPNQPDNFHDDILDSQMIYIKEIFPIELLIIGLKKGVVISAYSNSMLFNNEKLKYLWTYPLLEKFGYNKKPIKRTNPTEHITLISDFEELGLEVGRVFETNPIG